MKNLLLTLLIICIPFTITAQGNSEQKKQLQVGMMSAVDIVPFYVAKQLGYFEEEGVDVELIQFSNGQARQTALQTYQVDGAMTDIISIITSNNNGFILKGTLSTDGVFPLLSALDIEGKKILSSGVMEVSVTNFLLDSYLSKNHKIEKVYINDIPTRLEAIVAGNIDVGIFPEPFASIGALRGVKKIVYDEKVGESVDIIAFTLRALEEKHEQILAFHRAYEKAIIALEEGKVDPQEILFQAIDNLPIQIKNTITFPTYKRPQVPSKEFVQELIDYTNSIVGQAMKVTYSSIIDDRYIP